MPSKDNTLFLAADEMHLFEKLSPEVQKAWRSQLKTETVDAYETEAELTKMLKESRFEVPGAAEFLRKASVGDKTARAPDMTKLSEESWAEYFATIGACGCSAFIQIGLQEPGLNADQLDSIAAVSRIRHVILDENAKKK